MTSGKLLFDNKEIVVNLESPPKLDVKKKNVCWLPLKIDKTDLWKGKKNVYLEYGNELWCLKDCECKECYLNFSFIKYAS